MKGVVKDVLHDLHPEVIPYYLRCLDRGHKHFLWTGPKVDIFPRSPGIDSAISHTTVGEKLDCPTHSIYVMDLESALPIQPTTPTPPTAGDQVGKRRGRGGSMDLASEHPTKRQRQP